MDTLQDFQVNYEHDAIAALATEAEKEVINRVCVETAKGFELQCGKEYGFGTSELPLHQTAELHKLQRKELKYKIQEQKFFSKECKGQHSSSSSKSFNYIINNKNCSKITQSERQSVYISTKAKKRMN